MLTSLITNFLPLQQCRNSEWSGRAPFEDLAIPTKEPKTTPAPSMPQRRTVPARVPGPVPLEPISPPKPAPFFEPTPKPGVPEPDRKLPSRLVPGCKLEDQ